MSVLEKESVLLGDVAAISRPLTHKKGNLQFPNLRSTDRDYISFLGIASDVYNKEFKPSLDDDDYVGPSGVHDDFGSFRTIPGVGATPVTFLPVDNSAKREEMGLANEWHRERDRQIYRELFRKVLSKWHVIDLKVNKNSKSGLPWLVFEIEQKMDMIRAIVCNDQKFHKVLDWTMRLKLDRLFKDLEYVLAYVHNVRWQIDRVGKKRFVASLEYALSGGRKGQLIETSKEVELHGEKYPEFVACRLRLVQGLSLLPAAMEQLKFAGHMKHMFHTWPKVWHNTDVQKILDSLSDNEEINAGDVSDYDSTVPWFMFEEFLDVMSEFYSPEYVAHTRLTLLAPYVTPPVEEGGDIVWVGNATNPADFAIKGGIRSGHPSVSCLGKLFKSGDALCIFDHMNGDVLETMDAYLDHDRDLKLINHGDDEWDITPFDRVAEYDKYRYDPDYKYGYFKIEKEKGKGLIGKIVIRDKGVNSTRRAVPKIQSRFSKSYQNERGVDSRLRSKWPVGYYARHLLYKDNPCYKIATQIDDYAWRKSGLEKRFGTVASIVESEYRRINAAAVPETEADFFVIANNDAIHYAVDEKEVSPAVLDTICKKIKHDEWLSSFSKHYGGFIYG